MRGRVLNSHQESRNQTPGQPDADQPAVHIVARESPRTRFKWASRWPAQLINPHFPYWMQNEAESHGACVGACVGPALRVNQTPALSTERRAERAHAPEAVRQLT